MKFTKITAAILALGLAGCSSSGDGGPAAATTTGVPAVAAASLRTTPVVFNQPTAKVAMSAVTIKLPERRGLGSYTRNVDCWVYVRPIRDTDFPSGAPLTVEMRKALVASKVDVVPGEKADVAAAQGVDYLITGNVPQAHADLCINDFFNADPADVDAQVTVSWQIWSVRENRIVFQTTTTGTGSAKSPEQVITPAVLVAMGDATEQLLQSAVMQQYLTFGHSNVPQFVAPTPVGQAGPTAAAGAPAAVPLPGLVAAPISPALPVQTILVTLPAAGGDFKSGIIKIGKAPGFYIGTEGYAITSATAVGGVATVAVTDGRGRTLTAQVVRRANFANLALLKLPDASAAPLPILARRLAIGDMLTTLAPNGTSIDGPISGEARAGGEIPIKFGNTATGAPVVDATGNIVGVAQGDNTYLPIAAAFRALTLGVTLTER